jgi:hypothetical protein
LGPHVHNGSYGMLGRIFEAWQVYFAFWMVSAPFLSYSRILKTIGPEGRSTNLPIGAVECEIPPGENSALQCVVRNLLGYVAFLAMGSTES